MRRCLLVVCLLAVLSTAVLAASEPAEKAEADARLDQKVTIKAVGKPLGDFLKEITAQTGVRMTARKDAADIKVAVFVKDTPLSALKDALKECLHLMCTREGTKDEWAYSFWEDMKTRQTAERIKQEEVKRLRNFVDTLVKEIAEVEAQGEDPTTLQGAIEAMTPEQKEKLAHEDPDRYMAWQAFASEGTLPTITAYSGLSRAQVQALWSGRRVTISTDEMSPDLSKKFAARIRGWIRQIHRNDWTFISDQEPLYNDNIGGVVLELVDSEWDNKSCLRYSFQHELVDGSGLVTGSSSGLTVPRGQDQPEEIGSPTGSGEANDDALPDIKLKLDGKVNLYSIMEQVFDLTGMSIVADYYTRMRQMAVLYDHPRLKTADDVLRQLAKDVHSTVAKSGDVRVFSSRQWPSDRDREIPERLLSRWRAARKQYGGLRIQEALEMSNLSKLQLEDLELYKTGYGWAILIHQPAVRVAASLTSGQWQTAMSEEGLLTSGMSTSQLALVLAWAQSSEEFTSSALLSSELADLQRLRSCVFKIKYAARGEKDDDIKAQWEFELYPPSYFEAIRKAVSEAGPNGEAVFAVPAPQCRGYIHLAGLNQERGWPAPEEDSEPTN